MENKKFSLLSLAAMPLAGALCFLPIVGATTALLLGFAIALILENPYIERTRGLAHQFLALSIVGLGAGANIAVIARAGARGLGYTAVGITMTLTVGWFLGRKLKVRRDASLLICVGTAICGGSAIAAVAPAVKAKHHDISVALATVFLLNATALILFPWIGHSLGLTQTQFGLWSALAIHDTSSVVAATMRYGPKALEIGTTVKLTRALWIIPVALAAGFWFGEKKEGKRTRLKLPWFLAGFIATALAVAVFPTLKPAGLILNAAAQRLLVVTLFLIGANMTREALKEVGVRPLIQGVVLWGLVASASLGAVVSGVVR
jgi:uncharacterized integral membrane protein (TIGR00698 family)